MKKLLLTLIVSLAFCGSIFAQQPETHWPDFSYKWDNQSGICAAFAINGHVYTMDDEGWDALEVAFFVGEEMRGFSFLDPEGVLLYGGEYPTTNGAGIGYTTPGETVSFKLFDHNNEVLYEECEVTYLGEPLTIITGEEHLEEWFDEPYAPIILNFIGDEPTPSTYTIEIEPYDDAEGRDGYYLIASPIGAIQVKYVEGLMTPSYDLYAFNPATDGDGKEWINHRDEEDFELQPGYGYLYANNTGTDLTFEGTGVTEGAYDVTLQYVTDNPDFPETSWNLLGNPFCVDATIGDTKPFYRMINGVLEAQAAGTPIPAKEGFFVNAEEEEESITIVPAQGSKAPKLALSLSNSGKVIDRAILSFGQGQQLPKFQLFSNTKVYIPVEGKDYAIVNSAKQGEMPVSFKAESNGTYTLSVNTEAMGMSYLHLIDNRTGDDIDLLATPSYTFDARFTDYANRFKLVYCAGELGDNSDFAFISDGNLIVNGKGTLQVIDVLGHQLFSKELSTANCQLPTANFSKGVYVLQLTNGNDLKTQKIVIE